ncbi:sulfurtransferase [Phormidium sp. CCY1219]|uniref:sulfurtransferase n=1 Tax=Phormidium sp. CCY1219 TaxID=2886104 RepID=UPI002D1F5D54|nr:sulfurtransferase [Phormidium sp. CCY1219]MEB3827955.1 sulfurtransferase [Phormidium sp. CCY1219]
MTDTDLIVSPQWLYEHRHDPQLAIADCRFSLAEPEQGQEQYRDSHIPGAHYLHLNRDLSGPVQKHGGRHPLPDPMEFAKKMAAIGISSPETLVVAYDDSRFAFAARLWWLLRYLGHDRIVLLDGGFQGWKSASYPVTDEVPKPTPGSFTPQLRSDRLVDIETVRTRKDRPEVVLVDSRDSDRYRGEREPIDPIAGHIPGAVNYPWKQVSDDRGIAKSYTEQQQRWKELENAEEIMVYCGSGVTACVNLLSMEMAGIPNAKLYAGSWSDWCSYLIEG